MAGLADEQRSDQEAAAPHVPWEWFHRISDRTPLSDALDGEQ